MMCYADLPVTTSVESISSSSTITTSTTATMIKADLNFALTAAAASRAFRISSVMVPGYSASDPIQLFDPSNDRGTPTLSTLVM
jgi:hypothetical protein